MASGASSPGRMQSGASMTIDRKHFSAAAQAATAGADPVTITRYPALVIIEDDDHDTSGAN